MKKITFTMPLLFLTLIVNAQITFQKTYGGTGHDYGLSVEPISDGYIITGYTPSYGAGNEDVYLIRTNLNGDTMWTKTIGGSGADHGNAVHQAPDGGFMIAGYTQSFGSGNSDAYLIKTDSIGNVLWTKTYGGTMSDGASDFQIMNDGGTIICGVTNSFGFGNSDAYLIRTDSNGDTLWTKTCGGASGDDASSIKLTNDSGFIFCGRTYSFGAGGTDFYVVKTDSSGNALWSKTFGDANNGDALSIIATSTNEYLIAGTSSYLSNPYVIHIIKTDSIGHLIWNKVYANISYSYGVSAVEAVDGNYVIGGYANNQACMLKTDTSGTVLWSNTYGGSGGHNGTCVRQGADGGFVVLGYAHLGAGGFDAYLVKTDSTGNSGCNQTNLTLTNTNQSAQVQNPVNFIFPTNTVITLPASSTGSGAIITTLCSATNVYELQKEIDIEVYPNPISEKLTIKFPDFINKSIIEIYNFLGEKVLKEIVLNESKKEITLNNISNGIYFVKVSDEEKSYCRKIIVQHD